MTQAVPSVIRCGCAVSRESPVFWRLSSQVFLLTVGQMSCTVFDRMMVLSSFSVLYLILVKMPQAVPNGIRCGCVVSRESQVFCLLSHQVFLLTVGQMSCTVFDVGPLPASSPVVAPGPGRGACSVPPPGVPIVAPWAWVFLPSSPFGLK